MSDPNERDAISVTLKQDGKDGTWVVFHGSPARVREQIIEVFEIENSEESPLFDLINEATRLYKAAGNASSTLGGRVVPKSQESAGQSTGKGSAWDRVANGNGAEPEPEEDPNKVRVAAAIEAAETRAALKELYARNKVHFENHPELKDAYKVKGKSLPE